jgi:hypothetical protein
VGGPICLGVEGRLMYIGKVRNLATYENVLTGVNRTSGPTYTYTHGNYKEGHEIGGLCYGLGANLSFSY